MDNKEFKELCRFYTEDGSTVKETLFSDDAEKIAQEFNDVDKRKAMKQTQIRKFYNEVLAIQNLIESKESKEKRKEEFKVQIPYIKMLIAKAKYSEKRGHAKKEFVNFIENCLEEIKLDNIDNSMKHFYIFASLFEAVIAYATVHLKN